MGAVISKKNNYMQRQWELFSCLLLYPFVYLLSKLFKGPINTKALTLKSGEKIDLTYVSLFDYLLQGITHVWKNQVYLIGTHQGEYPGVVSLFLMQELTLLPNRNAVNADQVYLKNQGIITNIKILFKFLILSFFIKNYKVTKETYSLLDVSFSNITIKDVLTKLSNSNDSEQKKIVSFVNAHCLNLAVENNDFKRILSHSDLVLPDGIGVQMACRMKGYFLKDNVNGTDLFPLLLKVIQEKNKSIFLLGGTAEVNKNLILFLEKNFPNLNITGGHHGHFNEKENEAVIDLINHHQPDYLFVAFGVPKQEVWIHQHKDKINAKVLLAVGGLFDFYSGKNRRAPHWMREFGLEWIYRIYQEPKRMWRRYIVGNPKFLYRVYKS